MNKKIITVLAVSIVVLIVVFGYMQYKKTEQAITAGKMMAPAPIGTYVGEGVVQLQFGECGLSYRVERSVDNHTWFFVATATPHAYDRGDVGGMHCDTTFVDMLPAGVSGPVYYRYSFESKGGALWQSHDLRITVED